MAKLAVSITGNSEASWQLRSSMQSVSRAAGHGTGPLSFGSGFPIGSASPSSRTSSATRSTTKP